jgi:hypothetical protein
MFALTQTGTGTTMIKLLKTPTSKQLSQTLFHG